MRPGTDDQPVRERVRKNVGRLRPGILPWPGLPVPGRFGIIFANQELLSADPSIGGFGGPLTAAPPPDTLLEGRILGVVNVCPTATRRVLVSAILPAPCVIRALTFHGTAQADQATSWRVLLATDDDTTALADPTGTDLIEFSGDSIGAEDRGIHANLTAGDLAVEPWRKVLTSGARLKLKVHNIAGATKTVAVYADLDLLA